MPPKTFQKVGQKVKPEPSPQTPLDSVEEPFTGPPKPTGLAALIAARTASKLAPKASTAVPKPPTVAPTVALTVAPKALTVAPKALTVAPKPPTVAPKAPTIAPKAPTAAPKVAPKPPTAPQQRLDNWDDYDGFQTVANINDWIESEFGEYIDEDESNRSVGPLRSDLFGSDFEGYKRIETAGRGTCLIHAVLACISDVYRKIPLSAKRAGSPVTVREEIGSLFRTRILPFLEKTSFDDTNEMVKAPLFTEADKQMPWYKHICQINPDFTRGEFLEDTVGARLAKYYGYNVAFFNEITSNGQKVGQILDTQSVLEDSAWIFIYNISETHYEAIQTPEGSFQIPFRVGQALMNEYAGVDKGRMRVGLSINTDKECTFTPGVSRVLYNGEEYVVVQIKYTPTSFSSGVVCTEAWLMPTSVGEEAIRDYVSTMKNIQTSADEKALQATLLNEQGGKYVKAAINESAKTVTWPMLTEVGKTPVAVAVAPPTSKPRLLNSLREHLQNWVATLDEQSDAVVLQQEVQDQEEETTRYKVDVPEEEYPTSEQKTFYQFITTQFDQFTLPPVSPDIDPNACASLKISPELTLYQQFIREYMRSISPYRGILVYHGLGSGKTCTSIAAAEALYSHDPMRKIVVLTPSSLQENFINELSFCGFKHYRLQNHWVPFDATPEMRLFAEQVMKLPRSYFASMDAAKQKAQKEERSYRRQIWLPDFDQESNFDSLSADDQNQIRQQIRATIKGNIIFIGYTGIGKEKLSEYWRDKVFDNAVIIIDEVHNLTRLMDNKLTRYLIKAGKRESKVYEPIPADPSTLPAKQYLVDTKKLVTPEKQSAVVNDYYDRAYMFYRIFAEAKNSKLIALSGTPIVNYPTELAICMNFLHGYIYCCTMTIMTYKKDIYQKINDYCAKHPKIGFFELKASVDSMTLFFSLIKDGYAKITDESNHVVGVVKQDMTEDEQMEYNFGTPEESYRITRKYNPSIQDLYKELLEEFEADEDLKGKLGTAPNYSALPLFPVDRETFTEQFVREDMETAVFSLKQEAKSTFARRIAGLVSYYKGAKKDYMPAVTDHPPVQCSMSPHQLKEYNKVRSSEIKESKPSKGGFIDSDDLKEQQSSYRFASRSASNFVFPDAVPRPRPGVRSLLIKAAEAEAGGPDLVADGGNLAELGTEALELLVSQEKAEKEEQAKESQLEEAQTGESEDAAAQAGGGPDDKPKLLSLKKVREATAKQKAVELAPPAPTEDVEMTKEDYWAAVQKTLATLRARKQEFFRMDPDGTPGLNMNEQLRTYSQKFHNMIVNIQKSKGSNLVYSAFKTVEGLGVFSIALEANGYVPIQLGGTDKNPELTPATVALLKNPAYDGKRYIVYTGDYSPYQRQVLLNIFNCNTQKLPGSIQTALSRFEDNKVGQLCHVFMITGAGAEGLSLKNVRSVHIMEPYWNKVRTDQVKGRAIRICSHMDLPYSDNPAENQRHVDVYTYLSVFGERAVIDETIKLRDVFNGKVYSTDMFIDELSKRKDALSKDFLTITQQMAVDCVLNKSENGVGCLGIALSETSASDFLYDPRIEVDLGKGAAIKLETRQMTTMEKLGGIKIRKTVGAKTMDLWVVKDTEGGKVQYKIYAGDNVDAKKILRTVSQEVYDAKYKE